MVSPSLPDVSPTPSDPAPDLYRGMVDAAPDAFWAVDGAGTVLTLNARAETMFGRPRAALVGASVETLVPGVFAEVGCDGSPWSRGEVTRLLVDGCRADGSAFPLELSIQPVRTPQGLVACACARDVSDRVTVERASERLRHELIASVSHELRTPLTSIMGYTEILVDLGEPVVSDEALRILSIVRRNAERQLKVVEDLLTLTVLGGGGMTVAPSPTDLGPVLRRVLAEIGSAAAEAGVSLVPGGVRSVQVFGDHQRLTDVVDTLVTNAVKFSARGDAVQVLLLVEGDHGVIEVRDTGGGLATPGAGSHFGMGEPVLRGIVEAHAGQIGVDRQPDGGTTVRVRLPLARG